MPLPGTPQTMKVALRFQYSGLSDVMLNTFYLKDTSEAIFEDYPGVRDAIEAAVNADLKAATGQSVTYIGVELEDVRTVPFGGDYFGFSAPIAGTIATGVQLPSSASFAIKKHSASLGRSFRGRWYWPLGMTGELDSADHLSAAVAGAKVTALTNFQASIEAALADTTMGFVSYFAGGAVRAAGLFNAITEWSYVDQYVDSQRRRLAGRGG